MDSEQGLAADMAAAFIAIGQLPPERRAYYLRRMRAEIRRLKLECLALTPSQRSRAG